LIDVLRFLIPRNATKPHPVSLTDIKLTLARGEGVGGRVAEVYFLSIGFWECAAGLDLILRLDRLEWGCISKVFMPAWVCTAHSQYDSSNFSSKKRVKSSTSVNKRVKSF